MRVALVSPYDLDVPGGVQSHVLDLAEALRGLGDEVTVIGPGGRDVAGTRSVGGSTGIRFNESVAPIALDPRVARRTLDALAEVDPDVVHVHEPVVPWVSLTATLRARAPLVGTFHAWSDRDRIYRLARPLARRAARRLAVRLAVSEAGAAYHARALGLPPGAFRIVPNGTHVARFASAEPFDDQHHPTLLFVGRLEPRKGLVHLVRAFVRLKTSRPHLRLLVVGEGPERDRCQALLPARLRADVVFVGRVDHDELPRFYRSCDLFVAPAVGGESFGIVLIEAMAAGAPVIASDLPGYRSVVADGVQGRLVPPGDPAALAGAIEALLDYPAMRRSMAAEGRSAAAAYDWGEVAARTRAAYTAALDAPTEA